MYTQFKRDSILLILFVFLFSCQPSAQYTLKVSPLFSDYMVLQQQEEVAIWGESGAHQEVTISSSWGSNIQAKADKNGHWQLKLATPEAGGPYELEISTRDSTISIADVMIGEVWLASGQSNMEMPLKGWPPKDTINYSAREIANANYPAIRMFTVQRNLASSPLDSITGSWETATPQNAGNFSASAYFFARRLHQQLNIPIGIIHSSWGGTPAEAWASKAKLKTLGDFAAALEGLSDQVSEQTTSDWFNRWKTMPVPRTEEAWNNISFDDMGASKTEFDDTHWSKIALPGRFDELTSGQLDGAFWFRKKFIIENPDKEYTLTIGAVDDMDATYINGQKVGGLAGAGYYNVKREFIVPKSALKKGENIIAIRAIDTGGPGAFTGPIVLSHSSGKDIDLTGTWKYRPVAEIYQGSFHAYGLTEEGFSSRPAIRKITPNTPSVLYNAMIHPLVPYTIKGAIWYQGESNVGRAEQYEQLFPTMIEDWRQRWAHEFPFYFVQIAPFRYHTSPVENDQSQKLRDAQRKSLSLSKTGMVVTMDIGNFTNIHPSNKQDVGARLAGLALANDYGVDMVASGPLYKSHSIEGNKIILTFDHVGSGLVWKSPKLANFEIAGADKKFVKANHKIMRGAIEVFSPKISKPQYVRYAWNDKGIPTLFNKEGLPASSFSTEE